MDAAQRLIAFFAAKGHRNLVLHLAVVRELAEEHQATADWLFRSTDKPRAEWESSPEMRRWPALDGYLIVSVEQAVRGTTVADIQAIQALCYAYRDARLARGEPCRSEPCATCDGQGAVAGRSCSACEGQGQAYTFLELSEDEARLAAEVL